MAHHNKRKEPTNRKRNPVPKRTRSTFSAANSLKKRVLSFVWNVCLSFTLLSIAGVVAFRFLPVWITPYMVAEKLRALQAGQPAALQKKWVAFDKISNEMSLAVIAAEDQRFFTHHGFDFQELKKVLDSEDKRKRGASTLTQQVAKNLFLWHGRSYVRKGLEAWFTLLIELFWSKERILEVYLNIAETDTMTFGVEAASQRHFNTPAMKITRSQAARIAAVLPNPKVYRIDKPGPYVSKRAKWIERQMRNLGSLEKVKATPTQSQRRKSSDRS